MTTNTEINIGQKIKQKLADKKRTIAWLAGEVYCDSSNLSKRLRCNHIHSELLYQISIALEEDFFALYSRENEETLEQVKSTSKPCKICNYFGLYLPLKF